MFSDIICLTYIFVFIQVLDDVELLYCFDVLNYYDGYETNKCHSDIN
jgi:hypothetical protein